VGVETNRGNSLNNMGIWVSVVVWGCRYFVSFEEHVVEYGDNLTRDFLTGTGLDKYCATIQWLGRSNRSFATRVSQFKIWHF
jgi:hypothetical protein